MLKFNKRTKIGTYTLVMTAVVLAIIVVINIVALNMPSKYTKIDMTSLELYTLSDTTLEAIPKINEDVTIYFICSGGEDLSGSTVNNHPMISIFLQRYEELNDHITVKWIDPVEDPNFTATYTEDSLDNYSLIVESAKRFKIVNYTDLYYYYSEDYGEISLDQYQSFMTYVYYYTGSYPEAVLNFDGESYITSALDYVTTSHVPTVYSLEGHREAALSTTLTNTIKQSSMEYNSLMLLGTEIPEDAEYIIINLPTNDISTDEASKLSAYLADGGNIFLNTDYRYLDLPNLMGVMSDYGLRAAEGLVYEKDANHYYYQQNFLIPEVSTESALTSSLASSYPILMPDAHGVAIGESDKNITTTPLFTTTESAYISSSDESGENEERSFNLAVHAYDDDSGANIIWCGSPAFTDQWNGYTNGANFTYYMSILNGTVERDRITYEIAANELPQSYLMVSEAQVNLWSAVFIAIIPLAFAVIGVGYWYSRRRR